MIFDRRVWQSLVRRIGAATGSDAPEDLLQSAYIRLEEYSARAEVDNPNAFLMRVAVNLGHDERRQTKAHRRVNGLDPGLMEICDESPLQDEALVARERLRRVQDALAMLPPRTREVFLMRRIENMKYREIGARLGITVSAVEKHVAKAALFLAKHASET